MSKTINDVIADVIREVNENDITKEDREVINKINALLRELKGTGISGKDFRHYTSDELSRIAGSLANLKASLAEIHARGQRNFRVAEAVIKLKKGNLRDSIILSIEGSGKKATEGAVKAELDRRIFKDKVMLAFKEEFSELVVYTWRACNSMLDVIQGRINVLQSDRADTHLLDSDVEFDIDDENIKTLDEELPLVEED
jgi:hypothetical protein